jgi:predicted N-acetyltransferase YhbS
MIDILPQTEDLYPAIHEINVLAFSSENEAKLVEAWRKSPLFDVQLSLVAVRKGKGVDHILFSPISVQTDKSPGPSSCAHSSSSGIPEAGAGLAPSCPLPFRDV